LYPRFLLLQDKIPAQEVHGLKTCLRHVFLTAFRIHQAGSIKKRQAKRLASTFAAVAGKDTRAGSPRPKNVSQARFFNGLPNPSSWQHKKSDKPKGLSDFWWRRMDSDHRSRKATDLQSAPFDRSGTPPDMQF